jgi:hypothetical protein
MHKQTDRRRKRKTILGPAVCALRALWLVKRLSALHLTRTSGKHLVEFYGLNVLIALEVVCPQHPCGLPVCNLCPGVYLILAKAIHFQLFLPTILSVTLIQSQLQYDGGRAYAGSGHLFILAYT